jgi:hypothetical protein
MSTASTVTYAAVPAFRIGTVVWVSHKGKTYACHGPSHTWHNDPRILQSITVPVGVAAGAGRQSWQIGESWDDTPYGAITVGPDGFRAIVNKVGGSYNRETKEN